MSVYSIIGYHSLEWYPPASSKNPINKPELVVVQIRVSPGVRCQLYEDEFHEVSEELNNYYGSLLAIVCK